MTPPANSTPAAPADPATLLRSRAYLRLLLIAAVLGVPISAVAYWYLALSADLGGWLSTDLPHALGPGARARLVAAAAAGGGRAAGRGWSSGSSRAAAGRYRWTASTREEACPPRCRCSASPSRAGEPRGRCRGRARGAAGGDRWGAGRRDGPALPPGGARPGARRHRRHRQLRGHQRAVRVAAGRRVPAHGGRRHRRPDAAADPAAGAAGLRYRLAGVHRPGRVDRPRPRSPSRCPTCRRSPGRTSPSSAGRSASGWRPPSWSRRSAGAR